MQIGSSVQFEDFHLKNTTFMYFETQCCSYHVESLMSCRSGIDDKHISLRITQTNISG